MAELVSVVIPSRNRSQRLMQAIDSVRRQDGVYLEIIIVDDASSDGTQKAVMDLCNEDARLRYIRHESPLGGGGARNAGADMARGEFIAFLDDDDEFLPEKLAKQAALLRAHPSSSAVSCGFALYREGKGKLIKRLHVPCSRQELLQSNMLGGASVCMVRTEAFKAVGGFDPRLRSGQDWDLWLKLHGRGPIMVCEEPLVRYNLHQEGQITGNFRAEYLGRRRIHLRYSNEMAPEVRRSSMIVLIFYRRVIFGASHLGRLKGLLNVMRMARGLDGMRYAWRYFRYLIRGDFTRGKA